VPVKGKFALLLAAIVLLIVAAVGAFAAEIWLGLNAGERDVLTRITSDHLPFAIVFALLFVCGLGLVLWPLFKRYVFAANLLTDETRVIAFTNASHRVEPRGGAEMRRLAEAVNELAARHEQLSEHAGESALAAREDVETERNTLAALLSELTQGVLVCNPGGLILLYNSAAAQLFALGAEGDPNGSLVALGRSVFGLVDRDLVVEKLEDVRRRAEQPDPSPVAEFATTTRDGRRLRAQLAPVRSGGQPGGFVLALEDVTVQAEERRRRYAVLQLLAERTRASVAKIRVAVEALGSGVDTESEQRRLLREIGEEAQELDAQVDRTLVESSSLMKAEPAVDELLASDLLFGLRRSLEARLGVSATTRGPAEDVWLRADGDSVTQAVIQAVGRLRTELAVDDVALIARPFRSHCRLELGWQAGSGPGELLILELPLVELAPSLEAPGRVAGDEQPAVFDFELFDQAALTRPVENAPLTELAYTVFDTETTGMNPSAGDEVISIGAVRIVNGRLLAQETFEQLIDPGRPVPKESQRIHGIAPEALDGQPALEEVLPVFARFAEDTVLVGFNVTFDLRFFELKEAASGIRFENPVLDTLTLSVVAQPEQEDHSLEAIAGRLGVSLVGRHTSLGDAILTGETFLKLVPLLAARGVVTLKDAREAAEQTGLTQVRY
jgi:DNA polymerase III subunit epsilon